MNTFTDPHIIRFLSTLASQFTTVSQRHATFYLVFAASSPETSLFETWKLSFLQFVEARRGELDPVKSKAAVLKPGFFGQEKHFHPTAISTIARCWEISRGKAFCVRVADTKQIVITSFTLHFGCIRACNLAQSRVQCSEICALCNSFHHQTRDSELSKNRYHAIISA